MTRRSLTAAGAVLAATLGVVPASGAVTLRPGAAQLAGAGRVQQVEQLQARGLAATGAAGRLMAAALHAAGRALPDPSATVTASAAGSVALDSVLVGAGDLTGDGVRDVLDARYHSVGSAAERLALFARNGATGAVLWHRTFPGKTGHLYLPNAQPVGSAAKPGVVLADIGTVDDGSTLTVTLRLVGFDRHGTRLWVHHESGTLDDTTNAEHHLPVPVASDTFASATPDWLIARFDSAGGDNASVTMTPVRVRGTNGAVVALGAAVTSTTGVPSIVDVPDLSGDSLADVVLVIPGSGDGTGVEARHGVDGSQIWTSTSLTLNDGATAIPVGDVHESASGSPPAPDIAVSTGPPTGGGLGLPLPIPDPTAPSDHGEVALLDGASGSDVWSKPPTGDFAYAVEKAGSPLVPATGVVQTDTTSDSTTTTATLTLTTYDDSGNQVYAATFKATAPTSSDSSAVPSALALVEPVGDFEPDGSIDGIVILIVSSGNNTGVLVRLFHGADGSQLHSGAAQPLGASTNGKGDGLYVTKATTKRGVTVTVKRATDNTVLFRRHILRSTGTSTADAFGTTLHKSACADVLVSGEGRHHAIGAVLSGAGGVDWVVRFTPGSTTAGTVYRPRTPAKQPTCAPLAATG